MYKCLFLDLDDTLWDFSGNAEETFREVYELYAFHRYFDSFEQFYSLYKQRNAALWKEYGDGAITKDELNRQRFAYPLLCVGVDVQFEVFEQFFRVFVHFGVVHHDDGAKTLGGVAAQPDVLGDSPGRDGLELLMHHGDAFVQSVQRGGDGDLLSFVLDLALVHLVNAEHAFHQGGFAGAVLAHQGHDGAGAQLKPGMVQSFDAGEDLDDVFHDQTVLCHSVEPPFTLHTHNTHKKEGVREKQSAPTHAPLIHWGSQGFAQAAGGPCLKRPEGITDTRRRSPG